MHTQQLPIKKNKRRSAKRRGEEGGRSSVGMNGGSVRSGENDFAACNPSADERRAATE